jgi:hypothetical protein
MPPVQKANLPINFAKGIDQKSDPFQVQLGRFLSLENTTFSKIGRLTKRNGYRKLTPLPDDTSLPNLISTFAGNLITLGDQIQAYSAGSATWVSKGSTHPVNLSTLSLVRTGTNQSQCDAVPSSNGLVCVVYSDDQPGGTVYKYAIADIETGQNIVSPTTITPSAGTVDGAPRVFFLGKFFAIVFTANNGGSYSLQYIAVNSTIPTSVSAPDTISSQYDPDSQVAFDGYVANNSLYLAWNGSDVGGSVRMTYIDSTLTQHNTIAFATEVATTMGIYADESGVTPVVYVAYYDSVSQDGSILAVDSTLNTVLAPTSIISGEDVANITLTAVDGTATILYEVNNAYSFDAALHPTMSGPSQLQSLVLLALLPHFADRLGWVLRRFWTPIPTNTS